MFYIKLLTNVMYASDTILIMQSEGQDYYNQYV